MAPTSGRSSLAASARHGLGIALVASLAAAGWSHDEERALTVARSLETGMVNVNGYGFDPLAPFGGYKQSVSDGRWALPGSTSSSKPRRCSASRSIDGAGQMCSLTPPSSEAVDVVVTVYLLPPRPTPNGTDAASRSSTPLYCVRLARSACAGGR